MKKGILMLMILCLSSCNVLFKKAYALQEGIKSFTLTDTNYVYFNDKIVINYDSDRKKEWLLSNDLKKHIDSVVINSLKKRKIVLTNDIRNANKIRIDNIEILIQDNVERADIENFEDVSYNTGDIDVFNFKISALVTPNGKTEKIEKIFKHETSLRESFLFGLFVVEEGKKSNVDAIVKGTVNHFTYEVAKKVAKAEVKN